MNYQDVWNELKETTPEVTHYMTTDGEFIKIKNDLKNRKAGERVMMRGHWVGVAVKDSTWRDDYIWVQVYGEWGDSHGGR
jgi:hypothetical protein